MLTLTWQGREAAEDALRAPCTVRLRHLPESQASSPNRYIIGDCLDALRCLREELTGRIKLICIDPPYNTGSNHIYHDRFSSSSSLHDAWCSMLYPRLGIARELLAEDGCICICIGEQELHTLLFLCNELFGEENRITVFSRITKRSGNNGVQFSPCVDYIVVYARCAAKLPPYHDALPAELVSRYKKADEYLAERGRYQEVSFFMSALRHGGSSYPVTCPDGEIVIPPDGKPWRWNAERFARGLQEGRIVFKKSTRSPLRNLADGSRAHWNIYTKTYLNERTGGMHPRNYSEAFPNSLATHELRRLGIPFDFAKPVDLIASFVRFQTGGEDIVLDFFSGSATTAHAVMQVNAEDGGRRRFIMVQLPEAVAPDSKAYAQGFRTICDIGMERIRRAGEQLRGMYPESRIDDSFQVLDMITDHW